MPVNEINAPYYIKVRVNTGVARHVHRIHFASGSTVEVLPTSPMSWAIRANGGAVATPISTVVRQVWNRVKTVIAPATQFESIELWSGLPGANQFIGYNPVPGEPIVFTGTAVAASYWMFVFEASNRQKTRMVWFDGVEPRPQRGAFPSPPDMDDGSLGWYILKSDVPFATQDGWPLVRGVSENVGYNRSLARRYGRQIAP